MGWRASGASGARRGSLPGGKDAFGPGPREAADGRAIPCAPLGGTRAVDSIRITWLWSVNKIGSLSDFQWCRNLQELYVRRNEIRDLNQVCYLRDLPRLRSLWLDENPCSSCELYRVTVLRALPHLQKLDNVPVAPEEVQDALRRGVELCHPEDARANEVPQQHQHQHLHQQQQVPMPDSRQHSPARQEQRSPPRRHAPSDPDPDSEPEAQQPAGLFYDTDRRNANYEPDATAGYGRAVNNQYHNNIYDSPVPFPCIPSPLARWRSTCWRVLTACGVGARLCGGGGGCRRRGGGGGGDGGGDGGDGGQRGPHTDAGESPSPADELSSSLASPGSSLHSQTPSKNSNILSAVLCLIKELDFPSLEVVEVAVRSRMEEF
ncbi:Uncharacterized protein GBIM_07541 [Gryllus bimaculatus]|nr:Uncharacterized protein GBIM_07541 [Gryllus bimaculatus]